MPPLDNHKMDIAILLIEKNEQIQDNLSQLLIQKAERVYTADNGKTGIEIFNQYSPDIVIADIKMINDNGIEMAREIKGIDQKVQIVAMISGNDSEYFLEAIDIGIDYYVTKPVKPEKLFMALEKCFDYIILGKDQEKQRIKNEEGIITHFVVAKENNSEKKDVGNQQTQKRQMRRRKNDIIDQDLINARQIQMALLPREIPSHNQLLIDYRYQPLGSLGGDYFSFTTLREGGMGIFLGDVTGHGVSAALFLALVKASTDRACRQHGQSPKDYIKALNSELINNMTTNFLTAIYGYFSFNHNSGNYDSGNHDSGVTFNFAIGGHPPPIIYRASTNHVELLRLKGTILGAIDNIVLQETSIVLNNGDCIFLYTDGLNETINSNNDLLGFDRLCRLICQAKRSDLSTTLDSIINGVEKYRGRAPINDDVVLIGCEVI
ncbi:MAG: Protein-glutamate methylesterase/protein-glutamine glutaminase [Syntrophus sp. SKADARSKE-3]|nr:Protein-glutamate methylesterase/protein-glutamine glutaminase [Syntrophus sp. SKADARSKE-3]